MLILIAFGLISLSFVFLTYLLYFTLIYGATDRISKYLERLKQVPTVDSSSLPNVSIIIPTFEEAKVIRRRMENLADLDYPFGKMEVIVIDDASRDGTAKIAEDSLVQLGLNGKVLRNADRIGLNASLNIAIEDARNEIICITDADVLFEKGALRRTVCVLEGLEGVGGLTGNILPSFDRNNLVTDLERSYRDFSNRSMLGESFLHSAFPGSGVLTVFKRSALSYLIPADYGSTDANLAMSIVKGGHRFLYVPNADVYESVPQTIGQHKLQKVRRAKRLIQVFLRNKDVLFNRKYGRFGSTVYPLKFSMHVLCPILMLLGLISVVIFISLSGSVLLLHLSMFSALLLAATCVFSCKLRNFLSSFLLHQSYLLLGLLFLPKTSHVWEKIERK